MTSNLNVAMPAASTLPPAPGPAVNTGGVPGVGARHRKGAAAKLWLVLVVILAMVAAVLGGALFVNRWTQQRQERAQAAKVERAKGPPASETVARDFEAEKSRLEREEPGAQEPGLPPPSGAKASPRGPAGGAIAVRPTGGDTRAGAAAGPGVPGLAEDADPERWYSGVVLATGGTAATSGAGGVAGVVGAIGASVVGGRSDRAVARPRDAGQGGAPSTPDDEAAEREAVRAEALRIAQSLQGGQGPQGYSAASPMPEEAEGAPQETDALDARLRPSRTAHASAVRARLLPDPTYLLGKGSMVPCIVARIVTTHPGMLTCTLMQDVYSANGRMLLLRKGAKAIGEQKSALLQGQARAFALWSSIDDGRVTLQLDSPATDPLGGSGIPAAVDSHFWERFGGAMMVSFLGDLGQAMVKSSEPTGTTVVLGGASNTARTLAEETLKNTINIAPTGYVDQGSVVYIYVARHVDFGGVYELRRR